MSALGYADQGSGFRRVQQETTSTRAFWQAIDAMRMDDVRQPPEGVRNTVGHPVWGLRLVDVAGEPYWCFTVQGRGGEFGVAGTCLFHFAPRSDAPGDVWAAGRESVAGVPRTDPLPPTVPERVRRLFDDVAAGLRTIVLDGDPAEVALVIECALHALPASVSADIAWTTCLLQPHNRRLGTVTGQLPATLTAQAPSLELHQSRVLGNVPDHAPARVTRSGDQAEAVDWMLSEAYKGHSAEVVIGARASGIPALLDKVIDGALKPIPERVPLMLRNSTSWHRLLDGDGATARTTWVERSPADALAFVMGQPKEELAVAVFGDLFTLQRKRAKARPKDGPMVNLVALPTAATPPPEGWIAALSQLLPASWGHGETAAKVMLELYAGSTPAERLSGRALLMKLGLVPSRVPALFPVDVVALRAALARGRLDADASAEFHRLDNALAFIEDWYRHAMKPTIPADEFADNVAAAYRTVRSGKEKALAELITAIRDRQEELGTPREWCHAVRQRLDQPHSIRLRLSDDVRTWMDAQAPKVTRPRPPEVHPGPPPLPTIHRPEPGPGPRDPGPDRPDLYILVDQLMEHPDVEPSDDQAPDGPKPRHRQPMSREKKLLTAVAIVLIASIIGVLVAWLMHGKASAPTPTTVVTAPTAGPPPGTP